jgi:hypothetical protein
MVTTRGIPEGWRIGARQAAGTRATIIGIVSGRGNRRAALAPRQTRWVKPHLGSAGETES